MSRPVQRKRRGGQALVEFSLVLIPFLFLLIGVVDLGRGIYINNGVAQAAREIARVTSVHPGGVLGTSAQTAAVIATQRGLIPGLADPSASITFQCTDITDSAISNSSCRGEDKFVRVTVQVPFSVITPLLSMVTPTTLSSTSHVKLP